MKRVLLYALYIVGVTAVMSICRINPSPTVIVLVHMLLFVVLVMSCMQLVSRLSQEKKKRKLKRSEVYMFFVPIGLITLCVVVYIVELLGKHDFSIVVFQSVRVSFDRVFFAFMLAGMGDYAYRMLEMSNLTLEDCRRFFIK